MYYSSHLKKIMVRKGQKVAAGELLTLSGTSGDARKYLLDLNPSNDNWAHQIHFGLSLQSEYDQSKTKWLVRRGKIDPRPLLEKLER